jgi:hypothetical protein
MKAGKIWVWIYLVILVCAAGWAQDTRTANDLGGGGVAIPRLVRFSGIVNDESGKPMHGVAGITFALYRERDGGAPLWLETQNVELDGKGHYAVLLGASKADGLPSDLFISGDARWLGVQPERQPEQPRVLLVSVPYALKAADAETVGGKPPSAFVLAAPAGDTSKTGQAAAPSTIAAISGSGTANFIPIWKSSTTLGNSALFQSGSKVGIGTTTPNAKLESVVASEGTLAFRLDSGPNSFLDITPTNAGGRFQTKVSTANNRDLIFLPGTGNVGIGQTSPAAKLEVGGPGEGSLALRLDSGPNAFLDIIPTNTGGRFQTVFDPLNNRDIVFAGGTQNFGVGTTSPNAKLEVQGPGEGRLTFRLLSGPNAFLDITPTNTGGKFQTVFDPLNNRDIVFAGGTQNFGIGTTSPNAKLESVVASEGTLALRLDSGPNSFLDITPTNAGGRFQTQVSTVNNRDLIFLPGTGNVGIGTTTPANTLEVVAGGTTLADAWTVRSSRRFKTNIQPLEGALEKVEQLQGVSYDRKSDGRHEIGVIAEDVDQVLPEVVSRDPRTKEAQGVDYARLAALLIEAVKSQQAEIQQLKVQIGQVTSSSAYGQ